MLWKLFDMFIGVIQAFIFALLTVLYFAMAGAGHGDEHDEDDEHDEHDRGRRQDPRTRAADHSAGVRLHARPQHRYNTRHRPRRVTKERQIKWQ